MKKVILTCTLITMYLGAAAQNDSTSGTNTDRNKTDQTEPNQSGTQNQDQNQRQNQDQNNLELNKNKGQNQDQNQGKTQNGQNKQNGMNQCVVSLENGKVMVLKNGKKSMMTKDSTLQNGSLVMSDGFVKMKDGSTVQLKQGDCMDVSGKIIPTTTSSKSSSSPK